MTPDLDTDSDMLRDTLIGAALVLAFIFGCCVLLNIWG